MPEPIYVKITSETVFEISDPTAVTEAAVLAINSRCYVGDGAAQDQSDDAEASRADLSDALLDLAEPGRWADEIDGVQERDGELSAIRCDEDGLEQPSSERPDFVRLFPLCSCGSERCGQCGGYQLTPRTAAVLHDAACEIGDAGYDDVEEHGDDPVTDDGGWALFDEYPRITRQQDAVWRRQAARAADDLASDLERGAWPTARCVAEEMAVRLMLRRAEAMVADMAEYVAQITNGYTSHADDFDFSLAFDVLLQDDDLAQLFSADLDGIEDPDDDLNRQSGIGDYRPQAWFRWFGNVDPRDGRRPFGSPLHSSRHVQEQALPD